MTDFVSEVRDGMRIDWDVPIRADDGLVLRADVFRPLAAGKQPVILTYGPYGKWLHFEDLYTDQWRRMVDQHPDVPAGSTPFGTAETRSASTPNTSTAVTASSGDTTTR